MRCVNENILSHVSLCESQPCSDTADKKYVQDALQERGREVSSFLLMHRFLSIESQSTKNF